MRIWKFRLEETDFQTLMMPAGAEILAVQCQDRRLVLWASMENPDAELVPHLLQIIGTGNEASAIPRKYLGSVQMAHGLVWHVFEVLNPQPNKEES